MRPRLFGEDRTIKLSSRNVTIGGQRTSLRLEEEIWNGLDEICQREGLTLSELCSIVENRRHGASRTSSVRVFVLTYFRAAATAGGHEKAGHGMIAKEHDGAMAAPRRSQLFN